MQPSPDRALVIVGHGSHLNSDSAAPIMQHTAALRTRADVRALFSWVQPAFWKEEPALGDVLSMLDCREVVVVPLFISEGYFTEQVIPRELGLSGPAPYHELVDGKWVHYCEPVGTHPHMTDVVIRRARTIIGGEPVSPDETAIVIVGHGTLRNENSALATVNQVAALRARGLYSEVEAVFLDQPPFVDQVTEVVRAGEIVVVPYFIADGYHTQEDIPEDLGIAAGRGVYQNPTVVAGRRIWYSGAVGTAPEVTDLILERAREALTEPPPTALPLPPACAAQQAFVAWVETAIRERGVAEFGQIAIRRSPPGFELTHHEDAPDANLATHTGLTYAEELARLTDAGEYRPLKSAPTLRHGWRLCPLDGPGLCRAVNGFYPASIVFWHQVREGTLAIVPWHETAARQTGMFRAARQLTAQQAQDVAWACCDRSVCLKRLLWDLDAQTPLELDRGQGALVCREACSLFVSMARTVVTSERPAPTTVELSPADLESLRALFGAALVGVALDREGEVDAPLNRRRLRYLLRKIERADRG
ncbi:MAG TPA: hypothetical protein DEP84_08000 [Chloroflexi bacterium]|nr:hypothetical protein [Chloroflexota bacterium]